MHKAISTKVQGKICFETKLNNVDEPFWIFNFLRVFGFLTKRLIKNNNVKTFKAKEKANKQTKIFNTCWKDNTKHTTNQCPKHRKY